MKVVFFGASNYVIPIIESLNKNFELELVVTTEKNKSKPVISFCISNKIPYLSVKSKNELLTIKGQLGIVADFGVIIPKSVLDNFTYGVLNIHPSLLPLYRGPTPVQSALLDGKKTTGVSIIKLDELMDHGPILIQKEYDISDSDTTKDLLKKLFAQGAILLNEVLESYIKGILEPKEQDHSKATFTKMLKKKDGFVKLLEIGSRKLELERKIRAFYPWPGVWTLLRLSSTGQAKIVKFLPNNKIQVEGKKEVNYKDFLNGYPSADAHLRLFLEKN